MPESFAHLHVHSEYSMLDGAARLKELFAEVERQQMPAVAITDHGNMHGANDFYKQAMAAGVTPVIGVEAYVAPESRFDKKRVKWGRPEQKADDISGGGAITHMTLWARNATGLHNLFRLNSRASAEGHYVKWPRMDMDLIAEHAEGIMATTGCPSGAVQTRLRLGQFDEALKVAGAYQDIFGAENYFLELMDHDLDIERRVRDGLLDIGARLGIAPVVTNDAHYTHAAQATDHDTLLCIQTGKQLADPDRFRFDGTGYHLRSAQEMYALDSSELWQLGCRNTLLIAERVDPSGMFASKDLMPQFPVPAGETLESWFRKETYAGLERRFPGGIPDGHRRQAEYELGVIGQMGFPSYFLVVADFIGWAKAQGIRVGPGRGSAAGSLVAYALGITDLDPIAHGLIFERFLNPERAQMPDVDIDFDDRRRGEVIRYVTDKWGEDRVAQIATFGTIKAKAAIKDAARVLGMPYSVGDRITKAMPKPVMGKDMPLAGIFDAKHPRHGEAAEIRELYHGDPQAAKVIDTARGIEGLIRQTGVHAAGVIISPEPLINHVPLSTRHTDGVVLTQFDYPTCESLGLLKMDFLGLRNLTIVDDAIAGIRANHGVDVDLLEVPRDDEATYALLARGDTLGVFQLDGGPMRALLRQMRPDSFEDISAVIALYRPGPMGAGSHTNYALRKNGRQQITPIHPELEEPLREILAPTHGLIVYQEQVQRAAQILAGYSLGAADNLRRAMGKKKKEVLDKEFVPFQQGCRERGYSDEAIKAVWDVLVPFADYAFNKAHSAAYGLISYWTAYLKAHYPGEYMAALLTSVGDDKTKMALYLGECRRMGLRVRVPDVNASGAQFTATGNGEIRFGLAAVRGVGEGVVAAIVAGRAEGPYTSFTDFLGRVDVKAVNKGVLESLIKAGAFDSLGHPRRGLLDVHADAAGAVAATAKKQAGGQLGLFGLFDDTSGAPAAVALHIPSHEWQDRQKLAFEREMLGLYVSGHPLDGMRAQVTAAAQDNLAELLAAADGDDAAALDGRKVVVAGVLTSCEHRVSAKGKAFVKAVLEDIDGASIDVLVFSKVLEAMGQAGAAHLVPDAVVALRARVACKPDGAVALYADDVRLVGATESDPSAAPMLTMRIPRQVLADNGGQALADIALECPGRSQVLLMISEPDGTTTAMMAKARLLYGLPLRQAVTRAFKGKVSLLKAS